MAVISGCRFQRARAEERAPATRERSKPVVSATSLCVGQAEGASACQAEKRCHRGPVVLVRRWPGHELLGEAVDRGVVGAGGKGAALEALAESLGEVVDLATGRGADAAEANELGGREVRQVAELEEPQALQGVPDLGGQRKLGERCLPHGVRKVQVRHCRRRRLRRRRAGSPGEYLVPDPSHLGRRCRSAAPGSG